jgi:hypothetical protein
MEELADKTFVELLKSLGQERYAEKGQTVHAGLAAEAKCSDSSIIQYLRGEKVTGPSNKFQNFLGALLEGKPAADGALVLAKYLEHVLQAESGKDAAPKYRETLTEAAAYLKRAVLTERLNEAASREIKSSPLLANFPRAFYPLTVVCGDRRDHPAKDWSDLFVSSMSPLDLMFILRLSLDAVSEDGRGHRRKTLLFSDRIFAVKDDEELRRKFAGTNLLVIGSPKVNVLARVVNFTSVFRFVLKRPRDAKRLDERLREERMLRQAHLTQAFGTICMKPEHAPLSEREAQSLGVKPEKMSRLVNLAEELFRRASLSEAIEMFDPLGISDPMLPRRRARRSNAERLGLISLAPNPFDPDKVVIYVAGFDGVGTAHCLKALAYAGEKLADHPLGAVLAINYKSLSEEPENAWFRVMTEPYTLDDISDRLILAMEEKRRRGSETEGGGVGDEDASFASWSEEELVQANNFIASLK